MRRPVLSDPLAEDGQTQHIEAATRADHIVARIRTEDMTSVPQEALATPSLDSSPTETACQPAQNQAGDALERLEPASEDFVRQKHQPCRRGCASLNQSSQLQTTASNAVTRGGSTCVLPEEAASGEKPQSKRFKREEPADAAASTNASHPTATAATEEQPLDGRALQNATPTEESATGQWTPLVDKAGILHEEGSAAPKDDTSLPANPASMYHKAWILAPMVRISTLPFRLECLKYGAGNMGGTGEYAVDAVSEVLKESAYFDHAVPMMERLVRCLWSTDLVYSEEIVDKKLLDSKRHINKDFGTLEYICRSDGRCVFSSCEEEKGKVVLQLGTANAALALQAANTAMQDISAVDINMGCPKSFSVKGGMGAALLQTPDVAMDILKTLIRNVSCPVTCKIRLLDTLEDTVDFARKCESTGITAIAVHARKRHERPAHRANWQVFPVLRDALNIPLIANGDFLSPEDAALFEETYGIHSLMFARGAMWDPSLFARKPATKSQSAGNSFSTRLDVLQDYIKRAVKCGAVYQSIKFTLQEMTGRGPLSCPFFRVFKSRKIRAPARTIRGTKGSAVYSSVQQGQQQMRQQQEKQQGQL
ncbi:hypothetical protein Efla_003805 [Eimeria flavescens]